MSIFDNSSSGGSSGEAGALGTKHTKLIDDVGGGVCYVGEALPGSSTSGAVWRIRRITEIGQDFNIEWADGDANFDNVWNDRLTFTYS